MKIKYCTFEAIEKTNTSKSVYRLWHAVEKAAISHPSLCTEGRCKHRMQPASCLSVKADGSSHHELGCVQWFATVALCLLMCECWFSLLLIMISMDIKSSAETGSVCEVPWGGFWCELAPFLLLHKNIKRSRRTQNLVIRQSRQSFSLLMPCITFSVFKTTEWCCSSILNVYVWMESS